MPVRTRTTVANTVLSLPLAPGEWDHVAIFNRGTTDVHATLKGADPVADADDVYTIPAGARRELHWQGVTGNDVRVISAAVNKIEVEWA